MSKQQRAQRGGRGGREFSGEHLTQIAMPMGGIGAGCVCLTGIGSIQDFSIQNRPSATALPDGHVTRHTAFALVHVKGRKPQTLLAEGPLPAGWVYDRGLQGQGMRLGGSEGMPRFRKCRFRATYPFGQVELSDADMPLEVTITGWSPLVPRDDRSSGAPAAILEYTLRNRSNKTIEAELSYHVSNWTAANDAMHKKARSALIPGGVMLANSEAPNSEQFGTASLCVAGHEPRVKGSWFRGWWFDGPSVVWRECSAGQFQETGAATEDGDGRHGASVLVPLTIKPGKSATVPVVLAWHFPNSNITAGTQPQPAAACGEGCNCAPAEPKWKPWYSTQWQNAGEVAGFVRGNYQSLRDRTKAFADALHGSTAPAEVIDAVASNLAILKSPTVLRPSSGSLWGWEGCFSGGGCCHGSCTHVWNYAQAIPHLFPQLERTLRETEYERSMDERGHVNFRATLPEGPASHTYHAASDGQLGGIMKLWREWQISGDRQWLARLYPGAKRSLEFCIGKWDPDRKGLLFEPHHNTYDIEFWGPDGMCTSVYLGALSAMALMAQEMGEDQYASECRELAQRGASAMAQMLFNGEYYQQKVVWRELRDRSFADRIAGADPTNAYARIEREEGPKYQYGDGCLSDGVIGSWMATLYGIDTPVDRAQIRKSLTAIFKHNFRKDLSRHVCLQRPGYAVGDEAGLILCSWPRGGQLTLPFPYSDEIWTGIEYQVASHLILEGMVDEGLAIVRAARARYDGRTRNPFNEYECGNYYARAMSSYALLAALSGFRYSAVTRTLHLAPKHARGEMRSFFSTASGFGTITVDGRRSVRIDVIEGELPVEKLVIALPGDRAVRQIDVADRATAQQPLTIPLADSRRVKRGVGAGGRGRRRAR